MPVKQIARKEWPAFFAGFSRAHEGWLCTLETAEATTLAHTQATWMPFAGVDLERHRGGADTGGEDEDETVQIFLGSRAGAHLTHTLARPSSVWLEQTERGAESGLRIEGKDGVARIWFRSAPLGDELDDVAYG